MAALKSIPPRRGSSWAHWLMKDLVVGLSVHVFGASVGIWPPLSSSCLSIWGTPCSISTRWYKSAVPSTPTQRSKITSLVIIASSKGIARRFAIWDRIFTTFNKRLTILGLPWIIGELAKMGAIRSARANASARLLSSASPVIFKASWREIGSSFQDCCNAFSKPSRSIVIFSPSKPCSMA